MRGARRRAILSLGVAAGAVVLIVTRAGAHDASAMDLLARIQSAPSEYDFRGVVRITWTAAGRHTFTVPVASSGGVISVAASSILAEGPERVRRQGDGWDVLWGDRAPAQGPAVEAKYQLSHHAGPTVVGRPTTTVDASWHGGVRERLAVDDATGIMLRREELDDRGRTVRTVEFASISPPVPLGSSEHAKLPEPTRARDRRTPRAVTTWPGDYPAPGDAGRGFMLVERYRRDDGARQLFYSDGLYGVSVFEQQGVLDEATLPRGGEWVRVDGRRVREYVTAGGSVLMWQSGHTVATCVSDAPEAELRALVKTFPPGLRTSPVRSVADFVLAPFSWS